ncbi:MAG TPA: FAD-dependent oxidoreductase, partial [Pseudonocardiaceae bacterium]|nr:FAD-dependent oxidoreductase [Pseudonocardiaceae bacterium]
MRHRIVIVGAGYAGLPAANRLARQLRPDEASVTLISACRDFVERPRLHQLAVGQHIEQVPLTRYLRGVELVSATVTAIDLAARTVHTTDTAIGYDTLVYALGSNIDVTTVPGVARHCATLLGADAATSLHDRLTRMAADGGTVTVCG